MDRTILIIVVIGAIVAAMVFALNQNGTDTEVVQPEVTEVVPNDDAPAVAPEAPTDTSPAPQQ